MLWFNRHRRFRDQLSAFIDGELPPAAVARLEAHLAACEECRVELDGLRATAGALEGLPEADVPRSFTLTQDQVGDAPRRPAPSASLAVGMRLATAGVAAALAIVVLVDVGDFGDNMTREGSTPMMTSERSATDGEANVTGNDEAFGDSADAPVDSEGGLGQEDSLAPSGAPEPVTDNDITRLTDNADPEGPPAAGPDEGAAPEGTVFPSIEELEETVSGRLDGDGGGIGAFTAAEIALAAVLGLLLAASLTLALYGRKS